MIEDKTAKEIDDSNLIKDKKRRKIGHTVVETVEIIICYCD